MQSPLKFNNWSERHDLNVRPLPPQGSALAKLSYAPAKCVFSTAKTIIHIAITKVKVNL